MGHIPVNHRPDYMTSWRNCLMFFFPLISLSLFLINDVFNHWFLHLFGFSYFLDSYKQSVVACSFAEAECLGSCIHTTFEIMWLRLLGDVGVHFWHPTPLYCDEKSASDLAQKDVFTNQTKDAETDCTLFHSIFTVALRIFALSLVYKDPSGWSVSTFMDIGHSLDSSFEAL